MENPPNSHDDNSALSPANDCDFRHALRNTILLLGGRKDIADLLIKSMDLSISDAELGMLRNYNAELITLAKARLADLSGTKVRPTAKQRP